MFITAEPLVDLRQGMEGKWPFSPALYSWYMIGPVFASHQGPAHGVLPGDRVHAAA